MNNKLIEQLSDIISELEWVDESNLETCKEKEINDEIFYCNQDAISMLKKLKAEAEVAQWEHDLKSILNH